MALYGARGGRWAFTERDGSALARGAGWMLLGDSLLEWQGDALVMRLDERTVPWPGRIRGTLRFHPAALGTHGYALDAAARHCWQPVAPLGRVEVALDRPAWRWQGSAYLDANWGAAPLEADFRDWSWSRARIGRRAVILYDVARRDGSSLSLALACDAAGAAAVIEPPPPHLLAPTRWRLPRPLRADGTPRLLRTLEDAPFYARSLLAAPLLGTAATAVHESLSLDRFRARWVQALLPFRILRR